MNLIMTPSAEKFIRRMIRFSGDAGGFRLTVTSGGCSGFTAAFDVEAAPRAGDQVIDRGDLRLFMPQATCDLLDGVTVDYMETPTSSGFVFHDPKPSACQCSGDDAKPKANLHQLQEL